MRYAHIALPALIALAACKPGDGIQAPPPSGTRAGAKVEPPTGGQSSDQTGVPAALEGKSVLDAKYRVYVKVIGISVCEGTAGLMINVPTKPAPGVEPKSPFDVKCLALSCAFGKKVNIDSLLGGLGGAAGKEPAPPGAAAAGTGIALDDEFLALKGLGSVRYQPPLVMIPNFAGGTPSFLETMNETRTVALTDGVAGLNVSGTQAIKTLDYRGTWDEHEVKDTKFDKVFHFSVENSGFSGADKIKSALLNYTEVRVNLDPLALLSLHVSLKIADLLPIFSGAGKPEPAPTGPSECGTPPPPPAEDSALSGILGGGTGSGSGSGSPSLIGVIGNLLTKLININFDIVLMEQKGLKEAFEKVKAFDELKSSQTSGSGS